MEFKCDNTRLTRKLTLTYLKAAESFKQNGIHLK